MKKNNFGIFSEPYEQLHQTYYSTKNGIETFVISLPFREDRKKLFDFDNKDKIEYTYYNDIIDGKELSYQDLLDKGFDTYKDWKDPINKKHFGKGQIGCTLSHFSLWEKCIEIDKPLLIFEDDAVVSDGFSYNEIDELLDKGYNFIYFGWLEMGTSVPISNKYVIPSYPYWALSYLITPEAAKILVNDKIKKSIIPVDEYLPLMMKKLKPIAYRDNVVSPRGVSVVGSDAQPSSKKDYLFDFEVHSLTVGTNNEKCNRLFESSEQNGFKFINIGKDIEWSGGNMSYPGGGQKINLLKNYIKDLPDHDIVFFCDGYDVFVTSSIEEIVGRYLEMMSETFEYNVVFAAENACWPDKNIGQDMISRNIQNNFYNTETSYKYLNSGIFIGRVKELRKILEGDIENSDDDQLFYQRKYISGCNIRLDFNSYIFQCYDEDVYKLDELIYNPKTNSFNCVYHGNGGQNAKKHFDQLYNTFYGTSNRIILYNPTHEYEKINDDMLLVDFLSPEMCDKIISISDECGEWGSLSYDKFPAQEIRMKKLGLLEELQTHWNKNIVPIVEKHWFPMEMYGVRDAFVMRYSKDTQTSLSLHTDASLVTGSIKLNDDYEGAELFFPRQNVSNKDIPVGKCILFPGQVTHGHTCQDLISGVKYSLTIWTSRYHGDII